MESLSEKLFDLLAKIPKSLYLPIVLSGVGLILLSIGLMQLLSFQAKSATIPVSNEVVQATTSAKMSFGLLRVDVEGAVVNAGVYSVAADARVQDALIAAGGLSGNADRDVVAKSLNLAAKLTDGAKIYIPKIGDSPQAGAGGNSGVSQTVLGAQVSLVNLNAASESELDALPGIGPVTAQKIIAARPFSSVDDLLTRKAVTKSVFDKIKGMVSVY